MKNKDTNESKFLLRIDKDLKQKAEDKAKKENRSLNGYVLNLIGSDINKSYHEPK